VLSGRYDTPSGASDDPLRRRRHRVIGGALGISVGVFLVVLTTQALSDQGIVFAIPWRTMFVFVLGTTAVCLLASMLPGRRAARLNILKALQYE